MITRMLLSSALILSSGCGEEEKGDLQGSCSYTAESIGSNSCIQYDDVTEDESKELSNLCAETSGSYAKAACAESYTALPKCETKEEDATFTTYSDVFTASDCTGTFTEGTVPSVTKSCTVSTICSEYTGSATLMALPESICPGVWAETGCADSLKTQNKCVSEDSALSTTTYSTLGADECDGVFTEAE